MAWLSGWLYRKSHIINAATGAGAKYQVKITVHYGAEEDLDGDMYVNGKCRTDFGDIRFTKSDGTTLLDHWMESSLASNNAVFWIEIADSLESVNQTIYVYYGKADETTLSNGVNTFLFYDHFPGTTLDTTINWDLIEGAISVGSDLLTLTGIATPRGTITSKNTFGQGCALRSRYHLNSSIVDTIHPAEFEVNANDYIEVYPEGTVTPNRMVLENCIGGVYNGQSAVCADVTIYAIWELTWKSGKTELYQDGTLRITNTTDVPTVVQKIRARESSIVGANADIDWMALRKFVSPEPVHSTWGSEEGPSAALSGIAMASITEADIVAGGKTIIITLTGDEWIPE